jgi:transcriptional regulator with XRE-family HTH domain
MNRGEAVRWYATMKELSWRMDGVTGRTGPGSRTFAEKLDHLFETVHPPGRQYTHEEVAAALREAGGPTISATYVWQLRTGRRDNPTKRHLEALAAFFGVPVAYFFDDDTSERIDSELDLLVALRDSGVRQVALRTLELSPQARQMVVDLIEHAARLDGQANRPQPTRRDDQERHRS